MKRNPRTIGFACSQHFQEQIKNAADSEGRTISDFLRLAAVHELERVAEKRRQDLAGYLELTEGIGRFYEPS